MTTEITGPSTSETPYSLTGASEGYGDGPTQEEQEAEDEFKIVLFYTRLQQVYGFPYNYNCCCYGRDYVYNAIIRPMPEFFKRQQGGGRGAIPDDLWERFARDFHKRLGSSAWMHTLTTILICVMVLYTTGYPWWSNNAAAAADNLAVLKGLLKILEFCIVVAIVMSFDFFVLRRVWSYFVDRKLTNLLEFWKAQFMEYGIDVSLETHHVGGGGYCGGAGRNVFSRVEKHIIFRRRDRPSC